MLIDVTDNATKTTYIDITKSRKGAELVSSEEGQLRSIVCSLVDFTSSQAGHTLQGVPAAEQRQGC